MLFRTPMQTDRLELRPQSMAEFDMVHAMHRDPEVMRFVGDGKPLLWPREHALAHHQRIVDAQAEQDYGALSVFVRETGQYIGWCLLAPCEPLGGVELGYRYVKDAWGHGYATEAAGAVAEAGFELFALDEILAWVHPNNIASRRVLEKVGMTHVRDVPNERAGIDVCVYEISRQVWESHASDCC